MTKEDSDWLDNLVHGAALRVSGVAQQALISHTNTSVVVDTTVQPDPGDSLYEECLATQGVMTESEAKAAWRTLAGLDTVELTDPDWEPDYAIINRLRANERQLLAENAELLRLMGVQNAWIAELTAKLGAFGDPTPKDLPDPPRRPDGTRVPEPKPFPVVKAGSDMRRIGG